MKRDPSNPSIALRWLAPVWLALFALLSVLVQGIEFPSGNNVFHLPILLEYEKSTEGPHDEFSLSSRNFVSAFWLALAPIVTEENIGFVFGALQVIIRILTLFALFGLALAISQGLPQRYDHPKVFMMAFCLGSMALSPFFLLGSPLGGNDQFTSSLSHSVAVIPFMLAALALQVRGRFLIAAASAGLGFNINAFVGLWTAIVLGASTLYALRHHEISVIVKTTALTICVFILCALPTAAWILQTLDFEDGDYINFDFRDFIRLYFPLHTFADTRKTEFVCFAFAVTCAVPMLRVMASQFTLETKARALSLLGGYLAVLGIGLFLPYATGNRLLINLYPLRMDTYLYFTFAALVVAFATSDALTRSEESNGAAAITAVLTTSTFLNGNAFLLLLVILGGCNAIHRTKVWLVGLLVFAICVHLTITDRFPVLLFHELGNLLAIVVQSALALLWYLTSHTGRRYSPLVMAAAILPAFNVSVPGEATEGLLIAASYLAMAILVLVPTSRKHVLASLALFISAGIGLIVMSHDFAADQVLVLGTLGMMLLLAVLQARPMMPIMEVGRVNATRIGVVGVSFGLAGAVALVAVLAREDNGRRGLLLRANPLQEVGTWLRSNTEPNTIILPVGINGIPAVSRRPVWVDWKIGAVVMWDPSLYHMWRDRYLTWRSISSVDDAIRIAQTNDIDFVVFMKRSYPIIADPALQIVFEDDLYWVGRIKR